jgi:hypothetical protein
LRTPAPATAGTYPVKKPPLAAFSRGYCATSASFGAVERFQLTQSLKRLAGTSPTMSQRVSTFGNTMIVLALGQAIEQRGGRGSTDLEQAFNTLVANLDPKLGRRAQMTGANQGAQAEYLELQYLIQGESRLLIVLANIMKAEHDLAMSIVQNLR